MSIALINDTDFPAFGFDTELYDNREFYCLSVKASFDLTEQGLVLKEEQDAMIINDEYVGDPGKSGVAIASDITPYRQSTDILFSGHAKSPSGKPIEQWLAEFKVGELYKSIVLTGSRQWRHKAIEGWGLTKISPTDAVRLVYENAFGGEVETPENRPRDAWLNNPVGRGYFGRGGKVDKKMLYPAPQMLARNESLPSVPGSKNCTTVGLGGIPGDWLPRVKRIGTTDDYWRRNILPHLPPDFDLRYFNCAPDDQQVTGYLRGDEDVELSGLFDEITSFKLPNYKATALMVDHDDIVLSLSMDLGAVNIDLDTSTVSLVWSLTTPSAEWSQAAISVMER